MTKEQEQAIEWTKNVIKTIEESQMLFLEDITVKLGTTAHNNLQEILNLIQTLLTKIERLNNLNSHQDKGIKKAVDYTFELNAELEKKDKIIDEMAEVICRLDTMNNYDTWENNIEDVKQYFEKKVEGK